MENTNSSILTFANYQIWIISLIFSVVAGIIYFFVQRGIESGTEVSLSKKIGFRSLIASLFVFASCVSTAYFCSKSMELMPSSLPVIAGINPPF